MNKTEFIDAIAKKTGLSKKSSGEALAAVLDTVTAELAKGGKIQLVGFGTFEVRARAARTGRSPATGKTIKVPATKVAAFKAGKALKDTVNKKK